MKLLPLFSCFGLSLISASVVMGQRPNKNLQAMDCTFTASPPHSCNPEQFARALSSARTVAILARDTVPPWDEIALTLDRTVDDKEYNRLRNLYFVRYVQPRIAHGFNVDATRKEFLELTNKSPRNRGTHDDVLDREPIVISKEDADLTSAVTALLRKWGRFKIITDPDSADFVLDVRKCPFAIFNSSPDLPIAWLLVWPKGGSPATDEILWLEKYSAKWPSGDVVQGVFKLFRQHVQQLEPQGTSHPDSK